MQHTAGVSSHTSSLRRLVAAGGGAGSRTVRTLEQFVPSVLDLVTDASYNRCFTLTLYALVLVFILRSAVFILFLNNVIEPVALAPVAILSLRNALPLQLEFGATLRPVLSVRVVDAAGDSLPAVTVMLDLELEGANDDVDSPLRSRVYGLAGTPLDESGLLVGSVFALPGFPPAVLQTPMLSGANASSDDGGAATFRSLRVLSGLPGSYLVYATIAGQQRALLGRVRLTSDVASVELEMPALPLRVALGGPLPPLSVVVRDARGAPLVGKVCVLFPAPPTSGEFSALAASPDVLHPRMALLADAFSTPTDLDGRASFPLVKLMGSSLRRLLLWASVDGVVAKLANSSSSSLQLTVDFPNSDALRPRTERGFVLTLVQAPSEGVLEGEVLEVQPVVRVQLRGADGALTPAPGVVVFAFPLTQVDYRNPREPMSPRTVAELGTVAGTIDAVLGNLGRTKTLFRSASAPSDADGLARWSGLGFIRHGPAGSYTLGFAAAGLTSIESPPIAVKSSVASVVWRSGDGDDSANADARTEACFREWDHYAPTSHARGVPCDFAATICNWPACVSSYGASVGFVQYNPDEPFEEELRADGSNLQPRRIRSGPSGALSMSSVLLIKDAQGRPLAGKSATVSLALLNNPNSTNAATIVELPFAGASVSKLGFPSFLAASSSVNAAYLQNQARTSDFFTSSGSTLSGALAYLRTNLPYNDARAAYATEVNEPLSFFRVVSAPPGESAYSLAFNVEGTRTASFTLRVNNLDDRSAGVPLPAYAPSAPELCAHLTIVSSPAKLLQDGSTLPIAENKPQRPLRFLSAAGAPSPFLVRATNSFGVPLPDVAVSMFVVDALGYTMYTTTDGDHLGLRSDYAALLHRNGGVMTHSFGNRTASFLGGPWLHGPAAVGFTDSNGLVSFPTVSLRRSQNTWMKFGFAAQYRSITAGFYNTSVDIADYYDGPSACVSEYSKAIVIDSTVTSLDWAATSGVIVDVAGLAVRVLDDVLSESPVPPLELPSVLVTGPAGDTTPIVLYAIIDEALKAYPAHQGVFAYEYECFPADSTELLSFYYREALTPTDSALSVHHRDGVHVGAFSPAVPTVLGSVLDQFRLNSSSSSAIYNLPPVDSTSGRPFVASFGQLLLDEGIKGDYSVVAFSGGVFSDPPLRIAVHDAVDAVVSFDWHPDVNDACPGPHAVEGMRNEPIGEVPALPHPCTNTSCVHGKCVCGVCVCEGGWDGAYDCSVQFVGDSLGLLYEVSDMYADRFGGLPVYDVRRGMELGGQAGYLGDVFPRFLLPQFVDVGVAAASGGAAAVEALVRGQVSSANDGGVDSGVPPVLRVLDAADAIRAARSYPGLSPPISASVLAALGDIDTDQLNVNIALSSRFSVAPVLVTCAGTPVEGWQFVSGLTACATDPVPVGTGASRQDFETYRATFSGEPSDPTNAALYWPQRRNDFRLHLYGVPTGCYRFKLAYGAQGPGSRTARSVASPLTTANATSLGMTRPFRVLSPVKGISVLPPAWISPPLVESTFDITVLRGAPLPFRPRVRLSVRPRTANDPDLTGSANTRLLDSCSDELDILDMLFRDLRVGGDARLRERSPNNKPRCPTMPKGGLEVTLTAVSVSTQQVYSLYVPGDTVDCARTEGSGDDYVAEFSGDLQFPFVPALPAGASSDVSSVMPPVGRYHLRFSAYGSVVDSPYTLTLVDLPSSIVSITDLRALAPEGGNGVIPRSFDSSPLGELPGLVPVTVGTAQPEFLFDTQSFAGLFFVASAIFPPAVLEDAVAKTTSSVFWFPRNITASSPTARALDLTLIDDSPTWRPAPDTLVTTQIIWGPPHANAELVSEVTTTSNGIAQANLALRSGAPGIYVLQHSTALRTSAVDDAAVIALEVSNPVIVSVTVGSSILKTGDPAPSKALAKLVSGQALKSDVVVCVTNSSSGLPIPNMGVSIRFVGPPQAAATPSNGSSSEPAWLRAARATAPHPLVVPDSDSYADANVDARVGSLESTGRPSESGALTGPSALAPMSGSDGCVTLRAVSFTAPLSTNVALVVRVAGVEAPPLLITLVSLADAFPVSLESLKKRIVTPLLTILPLFAVNSVALPLLLRAAAGAGAIAAIVIIGVGDGSSFIADSASFRSLFDLGDVTYVSALDGLWWTTLAVAAVHTLVLLVGMVPELWALVAFTPPFACKRVFGALSSNEFAKRRDAAALRYVRVRLPRLRVPTQQLPCPLPDSVVGAAAPHATAAAHSHGTHDDTDPHDADSQDRKSVV